MGSQIPYNVFNNCNIIWKEDNVADLYNLDYLELTQASEEEIKTATPSEEPLTFSKQFVATYVSLRLKTIVKNMCHSAPNRAFEVFIKHMGSRGKDIYGVHVELSSAHMDTNQPF